MVPLPSAAAEEDDPTERLRALKREFQCRFFAGLAIFLLRSD